MSSFGGGNLVGLDDDPLAVNQDLIFAVYDAKRCGAAIGIIATAEPILVPLEGRIEARTVERLMVAAEVPQLARLLRSHRCIQHTDEKADDD